MDFTDNRETSANPLFSCSRPRSYWDVAGTHLPFALITGTALLLSHLVPRSLLPLKACAFLHLTGYPCPFCGFTRSFWAVSEGDWAFAVWNSPLTCLLFIIATLLFAWNAAGLLLGVKIVRGKIFRLKPVQARWAMVFGALLLFLNWGYRLYFGLK